ncbi:hemoblobin-interacting domain-containing protein [Paenibacillus sp. LjRoot56]|uniref:hemoblobin-interacting domain-containing protein n=1 Tax=Paenibacillus sp. LjRoot56 TaxID=3342333 RepID=UPI003ECE7A80
MKKIRSKWLAISILSSLLVAYVPKGGDVYAAYTPASISDNFDSLASGDTPGGSPATLADYTVTVGGTGAVMGPNLNAFISNVQHVSGTNSLSMVDAVSNQYLRAKKRFTSNPSTTTKVIAEASLYATSSASSATIEMNLLDNAGNQIIRNVLSSSALKYGNPQITAPGVTLPTNSWYKLRLEADAADKAYDIYVNGALVVSHAAFSNAAAIDTIQFSTGSSNVATYYIDDVTAREALGTSPTLTADSELNMIQTPIDLPFTANTEWQSNITGITVDGTRLSEVSYTISDGNIRLQPQVFPTAKTYTISVEANGYFNARVNQMVVDQAPHAAPDLTPDTVGNSTGSSVDIGFPDDPAWRSSIIGVTVDGATVPGATYSVTPGNLHLDASLFGTAKGYGIQINATGYNPAMITQQITAPAGMVAPAIANLGSGTYTDHVEVVLQSATPGAIISYRIGSSDYQPYTGAITFTSNQTITTKASLNGTDSEVTQYTYVIKPSAISANQPSKQYPSNIQVALSSQTAGALIYYKIDGVDADFSLYSEPITVKGSTQIVAKAVKNGEESDESSFYYSIISDSRPAITNSETFNGWTNKVLDTTHVKEGASSAKWNNPAVAVNVNDITADWSQYDQLEVWVYSGKATGNNIYMIIDTDNNTVSGYDYFIAPYRVDWVGWKKVAIPLAKFTKSTARTTLAEYRRLIIHPRWYANDPPLDTSLDLYFDDMVLTKKVVDVSTDNIIRYAKPGVDLDYTFTITNKSKTPTTYQLALNPGFSTFDSSYTVTYPSRTEEVAPGGELQVDVHVKVPNTATATDVRYGTLEVTSDADGSETSVKLQSTVVDWASSVQAHPNTMVTKDQLAQAKEKVSKYQWAKDYLAAVKTKADTWLNTTFYYPDRPGGHSIWYYSGDTPLTYNYNEPHNHTCPDDGKVYSGGDFDFAWRSTTHRKNIDAAKALAVAYSLTEDVKYAEKTKEVLMAYAKYYPSYPLQSRNGRLYWQSLDEAVQIIKLAQAYDLTINSGLFTNEEQFDIEMNLFKQSAETLKQVDNGTSNFQTWHNAAIGIIGVLLGDDSLMDVSIKGKSGFLYQMQNSVLSDGFWLEGAIGYHFYVQGALFMQAEALSHALSPVHPERDMYAHPNFKKMFEVPLQYVYPDLGVSNNNDSGGYPSSLVGSKLRTPPVEYEGVYAHYKNNDQGYAFLPEYESLLSMIYNDNHQIRGGKLNPEDGNIDAYIGEQAVFYGPDVIPVAPALKLGSQNFDGIGHTVLRAGTGEDEMFALIDYGLHGESHGHFDKLNLDFFGKGTRLAPDFGSTATYGISLYNQYYKKTFSHNTVLVDGMDQSIYKVNNEESFEPTTLFLDSDRFAISTNTANHVYDGVNQYERTVALTNDYAIDFFNVSSAADHHYDWVLHGLGNFQTDMTLDPVAPSTIGTTNGYQYLRNTRHGQQDGMWSGTWKNEQDIGLRIIGLNNASSDVVVGELPGPATQIDTYYDTVINRVNGKNASFVSILEPVNGSSKIAGINRLDDASFMVDLNDGTSNYMYHNSNTNAGKINFLYAEGKNIDPALVSSVNTSINNDVLTIEYPLTGNMQSVTSIIYAPNVTSVKLNEVEVPFTSNNGYLMVQLQAELPIMDQTKPETVSIVSPSVPDGLKGWYVHPATIQLTATDDISGVFQTAYSFDGGSTWKPYTGPITITQDGRYMLSYRSTDNAGNQELFKSNSVNLDSTGPEISVTSPVIGSSFLDSGDFTPQFTTVDGLSGVDSSKTIIQLNGKPLKQVVGTPLYTLPLGLNKIEVMAYDEAENAQKVTVMFSTYTNLESLVALVTRFEDMKWIDHAGSARDLQSELNQGDLGEFMDEVKSQSGKHIAKEAVTYLLRDSQNILDSLTTLVNQLKNNRSIDSDVAKDLLKALKEGDLKDFAKKVQKESKRISSEAAVLLLKDLQSLLKGKKDDDPNNHQGNGY